MTTGNLTGPVIPVLRSFDEALARSFYCEWLGFVVDWEHRFETGLPLYAQFSRQGILLHLTGHHGDTTPGSSVRIGVEDVRAFAAELAEKSSPFGKPHVEHMPWGLDEMRLTDPFSNRLTFYTPMK